MNQIYSPYLVNGGWRIFSRFTDILCSTLIGSLTVLILRDRYLTGDEIFYSYFLYTILFSFFRNMTLGRHLSELTMVDPKGVKAGILRNVLRELAFWILLPLICFQWLLGVGLAHERLSQLYNCKQKKTDSLHSS